LDAARAYSKFVEDGIDPVKKASSQFKAGAYTRPLLCSN
jgi:hypothetical protein